MTLRQTQLQGRGDWAEKTKLEFVRAFGFTDASHFGPRHVVAQVGEGKGEFLKERVTRPWDPCRRLSAPVCRLASQPLNCRRIYGSVCGCICLFLLAKNPAEQGTELEKTEEPDALQVPLLLWFLFFRLPHQKKREIARFIAVAPPRTQRDVLTGADMLLPMAYTEMGLALQAF